MAVPKKRLPKGRQKKRRMHIFLRAPALTLCPKCKKEKFPHTICWNCGYYKGREVINVLEKLTKKERKKREKEMRSREKEEKTAKPLTMEELSRKS